MGKTSVYSFSLLFFLIAGLGKIQGQDTIPILLKIRFGAEVTGPITYYTNKNILNTEAFVSVDLDEKRSVVLSAGYLNFKYSQYNYDYLNKGMFVRAGMDFNILKPDKAMGKYWAGIGLSYGISRFNSATPFLKQENYWGTTTTSIPSKVNWAHFVDISPGARAEIFRNFSMGWSVNVKVLVYSGTGKNLRPVYLPGFGNATKTLTAGITYFLMWNIPYKKYNAIIKKEVPEETEDTEDTGTDTNNSSGNSNNQQGIIR